MGTLPSFSSPPSRHRCGRAPARRPLRALPALGLACLLLLLHGAAALAQGRPPPPPFTLAVLPCEDLRRPGSENWLGRFLRERIAAHFAASPQVSLLEADTAAQWKAVLGLGIPAPLAAETLARMGVDAVIQASTQQVLALAEVRLTVTGPGGAPLTDPPLTVRVPLGEEPPQGLLTRMLGELQAVLLPGAPPPAVAPQATWEELLQLYTLVGAAPPPDDPAARPALLQRLAPWLNHPRLGGRAREAAAGLALEQALLHTPAGGARRALLAEALAHAAAAVQDAPRDSGRRALKAEIHYFLAQYEQARAEASLARNRDPHGALAFVVLGLVAGLSTGESREQLQQAFRLAPFLRSGERPPGSLPFQGGILEPSFEKWDELGARRLMPAEVDPEALQAEAVSLFEQGAWEEADALFARVIALEGNDPLPRLYRARVLIETGRAEEAVPALRGLAEIYPEEAQMYHFLGVALERTGAYGEARAAYRTALRGAPGELRTLLRLAASEMAESRWGEALEPLRSLLREEPRHPEGWRRLGIVQARLGDANAAEAALVRALELDPADDAARAELTALRAREAPSQR
jgi:Flp pilus assembly protein TadD